MLSIQYPAKRGPKINSWKSHEREIAYLVKTLLEVAGTAIEAGLWQWAPSPLQLRTGRGVACCPRSHNLYALP